MEAIKQYINDIEYVYQETMSQPAELKYPYLLGGTALSTCTSGFVLQRKSDNLRFMSTAGHCGNNQSVNGISLGPVVTEHDPVLPITTGNPDADFQTHNTAVRSFDLTNVIRTGPTDTVSVPFSLFKWTTQNKWVCKYGKTTGLACGTVVNLNFSPVGPDYAPNNATYVRVENPFALQLGFDITCPGDSDAPVFEYITDEDGNDAAAGLGILSGTEDADCDGGNYYFFYTPVDEIDRFGYKILTTHYPQYVHQNVFLSATNCKEYKAPVNDNGIPDWTQATNQACRTSVPPTSSGPIESYTAIVSGEYLREAFWRGGKGYVRDVPLKSDGTVDWNAAPGWAHCCTDTGPGAQGAYVLTHP